MTIRRGFFMGLAALGLAGPAAAQDARITLRGVAFDSLRMEPLGGAMLTLSGTAGSRSTMADPRGRFEFDSVAPGAYTLGMLHAMLDTVGFSGIQRPVTVTDGKADVRIAVPSFATIWKAACGPRPAPRDSGIVFGTVRNAADRAPVADAAVQLMWLDLEVRGRRSISERQYRQLARTAATGVYGICGVPSDVGVRLQAATDSAASGSIDVPFSGRVRRMDVLIAPVVADSLNRGVVAGVITDSAGLPFPNARVRVDGGREAVTDDAGHFKTSGVPLGTRQVQVVAIGAAPQEMTVDVTLQDTTVLLAQLRRVTLLDVVRVTASRQYRAFMDDLEGRKKSGLGYFRDSSEINGWGTVQGAFATFPSTLVVPSGKGAITDYIITLPGRLAGRCVADLWIDGHKSDYGELAMMRPDDFAVVEVYPRDLEVPTRFQRVNSDCGAVIIWTKRGLPK